MDEQSKTIIDRARALLAAAEPRAWHTHPFDKGTLSIRSKDGAEFVPNGDWEGDLQDSALFAAAPELLAALCDENDALREQLAAEATRHIGGAVRDVPPRVGTGMSAHALREIEMDYSIALQRAIEYHCSGEEVPAEIAAECPHHARMLNNHRDAIVRRAEEAEAQAAAALECIASSAHKLWSLPPVDRTLATDAVWRDLAYFKPSAAGRALLDRLHAAEAERDELRGERDKAMQYEKGVAAPWGKCVDLLRVDLASLAAKVVRLETRTVRLCDCMAMPFAENKGASGCPECKGAGVVIVEPAA